MEPLFFWKSWLSQWNPTGFEFNKVYFKTAEHWMMAQKALLFKDKDTFTLIMQSTHPYQAQQWGRQIKKFSLTVWDEHKYDIVVRGNRLRYQQNPAWASKLDLTAPQELVEASPHDRVWGIGMGIENPLIKDRANWLGENLLGKALMEVRDL